MEVEELSRGKERRILALAILGIARKSGSSRSKESADGGQTGSSGLVG